MTDPLARILDGYAERYRRTSPSHPVLLEAAQDTRLTTPYLIERALEGVRERRAR